MISFAILFFSQLQAKDAIVVRAQSYSPLAVQETHINGRILSEGGENYRFQPEFANKWKKLQSQCSPKTIQVFLSKTIELKPTPQLKVVSYREAIKNMPARLKLDCKGLTMTALPIDALISPDGKDIFLYLIDQGVVSPKKVEIYAVDKEHVLLFDPLSSNQRVIISGLHRVVPGDKVEEIAQ